MEDREIDIEIGECIVTLDNPDIAVQVLVTIPGEKPIKSVQHVTVSKVLSRKLSLAIRRGIAGALREHLNANAET